MSIKLIYEAFLNSSGVCTDTRKITDDCIFFALKGDRFNGNEFAKEALSRGSKYVVVDEQPENSDERFFMVNDVLTTLQTLANHHRRQLAVRVLAITGSNGKTTTKELIREVLAKKFNVKATEGNLNNHIGVPLTLLKMDGQTEIAIVEMGANHIGEIAMLCNLAEPDFGIITNIGRAHLEGFGNLDGVKQAKGELYQFLIRHDGVAFVNSQNEILCDMAGSLTNPIFYPAKQDYYHCEFVVAAPFVVVKTKSGNLINSRLIGDYNFENITAALCIGSYFGVAETDMTTAIENYLPSSNRSQIINTEHNQIILDAYNANPNSMHAALISFDQMQAGHKVAILGDMFELGGSALAEHMNIGSLLSDLSLNEVFVCGNEFKAAERSYPQAKYFNTKAELAKYLGDHPLHNATVLIKASRGMGLETLVEYL